MIKYLFKFKGKFSRKQYWIATSFSVGLILFPVILIYILFSLGVLPLNLPEANPNLPFNSYENMKINNLNREVLNGLVLLVGIYLVLPISIHAIATVKRYRDLNKSGYFYFVLAIPYLGIVWHIIECGFIKGTTEKHQSMLLPSYEVN